MAFAVAGCYIHTADFCLFLSFFARPMLLVKFGLSLPTEPAILFEYLFGNNCKTKVLVFCMKGKLGVTRI